MTELAAPPGGARRGEAEPRTVDIAWLAAFRILFGAVMAVSALRFLAYGWIEPLWVEPTFHFKYWGFGWVPVPDGPGMYALFWALFALATCVMLGLWFRLTALLFAVGFAYLQLLDVTTYLNHYYLATLLASLLALSPAGRAWSLDVLRDPARGVARVPAAWLALLRFQVGVVYVGAGLAKAHGDWLLHAQPLSIWLGARTGLPLIGALFEVPQAALVMSWAGFLFDTTIPAWLLWSRTRPWAFAVVVVFHTLTRLLFPIGMFSAIMVLSALVFFPPSWPRPLVARLLRAPAGAARLGRDWLARPFAAVPPVGAPAAGWSRAATALVVAYVAVQVALPFRYLAYGGNVLWHEQGMRFSWRVMVREKNGVVVFAVHDPRSGRRWQVPARAYLTAIQERELSGQPDLVLQLAHHVRDRESARVGGPVEVRAEALASLNGRRAQPLVDPAVDLAQVEDGLGPAAWITPAPPGPPPRIRPVASR